MQSSIEDYLHLLVCEHFFKGQYHSSSCIFLL